MYKRAFLTHHIVVGHGFIIRSNDTVVKPGYVRVFFLLCIFFKPTISVDLLLANNYY